MNASSAQHSRLVVGIDGSDYSTRTLTEAAKLAAALNVPMEIVSCWSRSDIYFAAEVPVGGFAEADMLRGEATHLVEEAVERAFGADRPQGLRVSIEYGHPAQLLIDNSETAAMLVVGRRGRGGFLGMRTGSVSAACVAHAHCPVVVINDVE